MSRRATSDLCAAHRTGLFDHFVGTREQGLRDIKSECLGGLEINYEFVLGRRLHRQIGRLLALEDAVDIAGGASELIDPIRTL
jgi:hypothetical protein